MKTRLLVSTLLTLTLATGQGVAQSAGNAARGKELSAPCVACHNEDGNSTNPMMPKISGQYVSYFVKQLQEFKLGEQGPRFNAVMIGQVANLSNEQMADLAAFYAEQTQTIETADPAKVSLGEKIYRGGNLQTGVAACVACHGPRGNGNGPAVFPRIGGQHAQYTVDQLHAFKEGRRHNSPNNMMETIAKRMTEEEIQAVSSFIAGLH